MKKIDILKEMMRVFDVEIEALQSVRDSMVSQFEAAVRMIAGAKGQVVVTGIRKSGIIANKIAATFGVPERGPFSFTPAKRFMETSVRWDDRT
jgi:D-arabinose 5-phosphate isomerase GutQ